MSDSDIQTVAEDSTGEPTYLAHENQGFKNSDDADKKPIILILNDNIQSSCKHLSTIFECEENLDGIISPDNIVDEKGTKQEEHKQDVRNICISEVNSG